MCPILRIRAKVVVFYFLFIRLAALFGHRKALALVAGQKQVRAQMKSGEWNRLHGCIWIHAASVGEFEQARPLIERIRAERSHERIVVTFFSPSGYEARKDFADVDLVTYLPFATRFKARRFLNALQPKMAVFVKYEFWPAYLRELKKRGIQTYSISSIFRPNQFFFRLLGRGYLRVLRCFTQLFVQDEASRRLLAEHGVHQATVTGDTRFDRVQEVMAHGLATNGERLVPVAQFAEGCERVIVAGSTWPQDEALFERFMDEHQDVKLILAPHEINEAHLHEIFNRFQGRYVRFSAVAHENAKAESNRNILQHARILVIDTMGLLSSIYRFGQAAYIGGGFGVGIHNTIEAAVYGMPVLFGTNYHHFREAQDLIDAGAALSVKNYKTFEAAMLTALEQHLNMGAKASEYVQSELGATAKIYDRIFD